MSSSSPWFTGLRNLFVTLVAIILAIPLGLYAFTDLPARRGWISAQNTSARENDAHDNDHHDNEHHDHDAHEHDDHDHADHNDENSVELTQQARSNMSLKNQRDQCWCVHKVHRSARRGVQLARPNTQRSDIAIDGCSERHLRFPRRAGRQQRAALFITFNPSRLGKHPRNLSRQARRT